MAARPPIDLERLREALTPRWSQIEVVAETASTNADLLARREATDRTALIAEHQTAGRGRLDRGWESPPAAGLTFSVLLRPDAPLIRWGWLPLITGVALAEAVQEQTGLDVRLKWPNDLLGPSGGKLAGILAQTADDLVVIGVGLNVTTTRDELPVESATSLELEGGGSVDRTALLTAILGRIDARTAQWNDCVGDAAACGLDASYRQLCSTLGASVRVALGEDRQVSGEAVELDETGRLVVRTDTGDVVVSVGDVQHVRTV